MPTNAQPTPPPYGASSLQNSSTPSAIVRELTLENGRSYDLVGVHHDAMMLDVNLIIDKAMTEEEFGKKWDQKEIRCDSQS